MAYLGHAAITVVATCSPAALVIVGCAGWFRGTARGTALAVLCGLAWFAVVWILGAMMLIFELIFACAMSFVIFVEAPVSPSLDIEAKWAKRERNDQ